MFGKFPIYQSFTNRVAVLSLGHEPSPGVKIYSNPVKLALQYNEILESGIIASQADLARHLGVSRAKITQILNLLKLPAKIRDFIADLDDTDERLRVFTERRLRPLVQCSAVEEQSTLFKRIIKEARFSQD